MQDRDVLIHLPKSDRLLLALEAVEMLKEQRGNHPAVQDGIAVFDGDLQGIAKRWESCGDSSWLFYYLSEATFPEEHGWG